METSRRIGVSAGRRAGETDRRNGVSAYRRRGNGERPREAERRVSDGERPVETGRRFALRSEIVIVLDSFIIAAQERLLRDNSERSSAIRQTERTTTRKNRGRGRARGRLRLSSITLIPVRCERQLLPAEMTRVPAAAAGNTSAIASARVDQTRSC